MLMQKKRRIGKLLAIAAAAALNAAAGGNAEQNFGAEEVRHQVPVVGAKVGGFWHDEYRRLVTKWLPHCIREMEAGGSGEELLNLVATGEALAGKKPSVKFKGCPWSDAYPYNTIEAICLALEIDPGDDVAFAKAQVAVSVRQKRRLCRGNPLHGGVLDEDTVDDVPVAQNETDGAGRGRGDEDRHRRRAAFRDARDDAAPRGDRDVLSRTRLRVEELPVHGLSAPHVPERERRCRARELEVHSARR